MHVLIEVVEGRFSGKLLTYNVPEGTMPGDFARIPIKYRWDGGPGDNYYDRELLGIVRFMETNYAGPTRDVIEIITDEEQEE